MVDVDASADRLAELYGNSFGGKPSGRYRIPAKLVRQLMGRRRIYTEDIENLRRALYERGYVLIDLDTYFAVVSISTFTNYRRANADCVE